MCVSTQQLTYVQKQTLRLPSSGSLIGPLSLDALNALAMLQVLSAASYLLTPHLNQHSCSNVAELQELKTQQMSDFDCSRTTNLFS